MTTASGAEVTIGGTIDRLDALPDGSGLAVYDYRLGSRQLSLQEVYHGLSLQLLTGLLAPPRHRPARRRVLPPDDPRHRRGQTPLRGPRPVRPEILLRVKPRGVVHEKYVNAMDASLGAGVKSDVIQVQMNKDGGFGNRRASDVADSAEFDALLAHVRKNSPTSSDAVLSAAKSASTPTASAPTRPAPTAATAPSAASTPPSTTTGTWRRSGREQVLERMTNDQAPMTNQ